MWDLLGPGLKPVFPTLAGGFLTTAPPEKSPICSSKLSLHLSPLCAMLQEVELSGLHQLWSVGNSGKRSEERREESEVRTFIPPAHSSSSVIGWVLKWRSQLCRVAIYTKSLFCHSPSLPHCPGSNSRSLLPLIRTEDDDGVQLPDMTRLGSFNLLRSPLTLPTLLKTVPLLNVP